MNTREFSEEVLEVLRRDGWVQGLLHSLGGSHCIQGAALVVGQSLGLACFTGGSSFSVDDHPDGPCLYARWADELRDLLPIGKVTLLVPLSSWNDDPTTSYEDIELLLKRHINGD